MKYSVILSVADYYDSFKFQINFSDNTQISFLNYDSGYVAIEAKNKQIALKALSTTIFGLMYLYFSKGTFRIFETYGGSGYGPHPSLFGEHDDYRFNHYDEFWEKANFKLEELDRYEEFEIFVKGLFDKMTSSRDTFYFSEMVFLYGEFLDRHISADKKYLVGFRLLETLACWNEFGHKKVLDLARGSDIAEKRSIKKGIKDWKDLRNKILSHFSIRPYVWRAFEDSIKEILTCSNIDFERNIQREENFYDSFSHINYPEAEYDDILLRYLMSKKLEIPFYEGLSRDELSLPNEGTAADKIYNSLLESGENVSLIDDSVLFMG